MSEEKHTDKYLTSCGCRVTPTLGYSEKQSAVIDFCEKHSWGYIIKAVNSHDQLVEAGKRLAEQAKYCYTPDPAVKLFKEGAEYRSLKRRTDSLKGFVSAFGEALKAAGEEV